MSKISIEGDGQGTGTFTLKSPASNNNRQFDLPDEAGTVLTSASDIEPQVKTATNATGSAPIYACRAWVNFDGTGTVSIRDSGNVSSITDNGTGQYRINFSQNMPDGNYSISSFSGDAIGTGGNYSLSYLNLNDYSLPASSGFVIQTQDQTGVEDQPIVTVAIFR